MFVKIIRSKNFLQASLVEGIEVADRETLQTFGKVKDIIIHNPTGQVVGLLVGYRGLKVAQLKQMSCIRRYNLEVYNRNDLLDYKIFARYLGPTLTSSSHLKHYNVIGEDGQDVGKLDDFHFSPRSGRISRVEVSRGLLQNLLQGKIILHTSELKEISGRRVVVKSRNYTEYLDESHTGVQVTSGD